MRTLKEQIERRCRHFNGTVNDKCAAGHVYRDFEPADGVGLYKVLPCFKDNVAPVPCVDCSFPTDQEVQDKLDEYKKIGQNYRKARGAITADAGPYEPGISKSGRVACPVCNRGTLVYSRAGINGHIHATCSTSGCMSWIESKETTNAPPSL